MLERLVLGPSSDPGMPSSNPLPAVVLAALCGAALIPAQTLTHEDPVRGFSFELPKRFKRLPVEKDRHCVVAHYISTRGYPIKGVRWFTHRPSVRVVHLPKQKPAAEGASTGADAGKDADADKGAEAAAKATLPKPALVYDDYRDYLQRNLSGQLRFEKPENAEVSGRSYTRLRIHRRDRSPYYLETWTFERSNETYSLEVLVLEDHREKLWPELQRCLESFQLAPEPSKTRPKQLSTPLWQKDPARWRELTVEQRAQERTAFEEDLHEHVENNLLPGWRLERTDNCLFVTDSNGKYVKAAKVAAEQCRKWLQDVFGETTDERVMRPVVRIFDSRTDYRYYRLRSHDDLHYVEPIHEIVVRSREQGSSIGDLADLHSGLVHHFLNNKSEGLSRHLPRWLQAGLHEYLRLARVQGKRWRLTVSGEEKDVIRDAKKRKRLLMPAAIMHHQNDPWRERDPELDFQRGRLIRFLLQAGKGKKLLPDLLPTYAAAVREAQKTFPLPPPILGRGDIPEEVRDARDKEQRKLRRRLLKAVNRTVLDLDQKQWKAVDLAWRRYVPK
jgi:hypothetical protein